MRNLLAQHPLILMEAAILEVLRRTGKVVLHPQLMNCPLIYDQLGRRELRKLYLAYGEIAVAAGLPILLCTPTWRASQQRVGETEAFSRCNHDAALFMLEIKQELTAKGGIIKIGGLLGCKNDCYLPEQGLGAAEAAVFHRWQIEQLVEAGVDFLFAATLPNVVEARGIAEAMAQTAHPYIIGFVVDRFGKLLDGTALWEGVNRIDQGVTTPPLGYMVNCSYPTFINAGKQPPQLFSRLIGLQANGSSLDHAQLDGAEQLQAETVVQWGNEMLALHRHYGLKILGGCCGTTTEHLQYLTSNL